MNISEEDTKELDSYGVWVKNSTSDDNLSDDLNIDESSLDLPDFDDTDFSDMFKDDSQFSTTETASDDFSDDLDTTLSTDELANITNADDVTIENVDSPVQEETSEIIEDNFEIETEEVSFGDDEEISLDDFMDGGFSDDSVASGNNGYESGFEPGGENNPIMSDSTEELSLDDFMDEGFSDSNSESTKQEEVQEDEPPLEMDISFDDSAETVQTEENISLEVDYSDDDDEIVETQATSEETEDVSLDSFGESFTSDLTTSSVQNNDIDAEEIDLSDFGIDASAEETPITQDVEEAKNRETVIDYDLSVGDENTSSAPIVSEISTSDEPVEEIMEEVHEVEPSSSNNSPTTAVETSLLQQIVADLSGLKDEINRLKTNIEEIKSSERTVIVEQENPTLEDTAIEENIIEETDGGFFGNSDEDDTLALSFDELDNIMNTADFSATEVTEISEDSEETEDNSQDLTFDYEDENLSEPVIDDITLDGQDEEESDELDLPSEISIPTEEEMIVDSTSSDFMDSVNETIEEQKFPDVDSMAQEAELPQEIEDTIIEDSDEKIEENITEETISEDDFSVDTIFDNTEDDTIVEEEIDFENTIIENDEPTLDETSIDDSALNDDSLATEEYIEDSFTEVDNLDNSLSTSNLDYLGTEETPSTDFENSISNIEEPNTNLDLKQDIKSVLLYMDQLLENLPEEKIVEFAKSEEFTTYKKLFSELGLS